jgi:hypothetical protein
MFLQIFLRFYTVCTIWWAFCFANMLNVCVKIRYEFEKNGEVAEKVAKKFTIKKLEARYYKEDEKQYNAFTSMLCRTIRIYMLFDTHLEFLFNPNSHC